MIRVSVIIPTRNRAAMLAQAMESAMRAGTNVEVVVVDDASSDGTEAMCRGTDGITFVRLDRNVGQARARNIGIQTSKGEFIAFLDDDDRRLPGSLDRQADVLARDDNLSFVYGQVRVGDPVHCEPTGEIRPASCPSGDLFWELLRGNFIYIPSVLVRRQHFEHIALFDPSIRGTEDWDAWIRLAESHPVAALEEPVAIYRDFSTSSGQTSSNRPRMCKASAQTLRKALRSKRALEASPELVRRVRGAFMLFLWDDLITEGRLALATRRFRYAVANYGTALWLNPEKLLKRWVIKMVVTDFWTAARAKG